MRSILKVTVGARPWQPSDHIQAGEVLHEYDVPLAGFLFDFGRTFLFANLLGDSKPLGVWGYVEIDEAEVRMLLAAIGPDGADEAVETAFENKCVTLALADDYAISQAEVFDSGIEGTIDLAKRFLDRLSNKLERDQEQTDTLSNDQALIHA